MPRSIVQPAADARSANSASRSANSSAILASMFNRFGGLDLKPSAEFLRERWDASGYGAVRAPHHDDKGRIVMKNRTRIDMKIVCLRYTAEQLAPTSA